MRWIRDSAIVMVVSFAGALQAQTAAAAAPARGVTGVQAGEGSRAGQSASPLERRVSLDLHDVRLEKALEAVDRQAKLGLSYTARLVPLDRRVSVTVDSATVKEVLEELLRGTGVRAVVTGSGTVMLARQKERQAPRAAGADSGVLYGVVRDSATGKVLIGAEVSIEGTALRFTTVGDSGLYYLPNVPAGVHTVVVRMLGYRKAAREVAVVGKQNLRVDFALQMGLSRLQEMVTTATGPRRRMEIANDVTIIQADSVMATAPIHSVSELLATRVPGLVAQRTSGAPGDPTRLRLRGVSSVYASNDPIVIVDGVRVYAEQSAERGANVASTLAKKEALLGAEVTPAPSPLDQIDPYSIETIEVLKGPSAATLYGADAANGVIVITTKRGRPGPARWTFSATRGRTSMPGDYPKGYYRWGHDGMGYVHLCTLQEFGCQADSLVRFQALDQPDLTVLGHGDNTELTAGVSGGTAGLQYALTGSWLDETGLLTLPDFEAARYRAAQGVDPPEWMRRPHTHTRWSGSTNLTARLGNEATASLTTRLTRERQQRSNLEEQLAEVMGTYLDRASETYYAANGAFPSVVNSLVPNFYRRTTEDATNFTSGVNVNWRPLSWLTTSADAGLNAISRRDETLLPRGILGGAVADTLGNLTTARGHSLLSTLNVRATATAPLGWGFRLQTSVGANYTNQSISDLGTSVEGLAKGTSSPNDAATILGVDELAQDATTYGWYVEPVLAHPRYTISAGLRLDGGSTYGTRVKLPTFPKLGGSWLISEESWFPFKNVFEVLRLRAAYGHAGRQPGPTDRLRLYRESRRWLNGEAVDITQISTFGNSRLKPERATELEGGFDADLLDTRLSVGLTGHRTTTVDAIMSVPLPPSVYGGGSVLRNVGTIRNTGLELSLVTQLVRSDPFTWSTSLALTHERNVVVSLGRGVEPFNTNDGRVAPGYPLYGRWAEPILAYDDVDGNGIIDASEVQLGDTMVYMGQTLPKYKAALFSTFSIFRGALTIDAGLTYEDGLTQVNETARQNQIFSHGLSDPNAPFGEQAAVAVMRETDYGLMQTISTLRFNSLSVAYHAPTSLARRLGARALSIAVQGTNLGLRTNYAGKDPAVNAYATGNGVADTGQLPIPRQWLLTVRANY